MVVQALRVGGGPSQATFLFFSCNGETCEPLLTQLLLCQGPFDGEGYLEDSRAFATLTDTALSLRRVGGLGTGTDCT